MRNVLAVVAAVLACLPPLSAQFRTLNDRYPAPQAVTLAGWEARAAMLRERVLASAGLLPLPPRSPLNAVLFDEQVHGDYRVAKVYFESLPGFYVTGNLYRPPGDGPFPAVLSPHGHWAYGRLENSALVSGPGRAITLARRGFVVFTHDMVGYNDSRQLPHTFGGRRERLWGLSLAGLQLWNGMRALDFLESLSCVRRGAIGVTGESGGGTQTFLLAAADPRVAVAVPVNMISLHMQGGCLCENPPGLRIDTTNVEIAATIAPRPLLMVSATGDWTKDTLEQEFPAVRRLYQLVGAADRVEAVRFEAEHNYNKESRTAMYTWMARWLQRDGAEAPAEPERSFTPDSLPSLLVFHGRPLPANAVTASALVSGWIDNARQQLATTPLAVRGAALRHALVEDARLRDRAPARPESRQPAVLLAGDTGEVEPLLRRAGFVVRSVPVTPFDEAAAAKVAHFETYNRTEAGQRVADIVRALRASPGAILIATGESALAGILAASVEPPRVAILDVAGFDTSRDEDYLAHLYIPGLRRAGDLQTASEMVPNRLVIHGAPAGFVAAGARIERRRLTSGEVVALARTARRSGAI